MKRYPAFEPPEYRDWVCTPEALASFQETLDSSPERRKRVESLSAERLLDLYRGLLRFRLLDIGLKRWVLQGVISKAWLGTGEEAVTIGAVHALSPGDTVGPMIRNEGACAEMGMPLEDVFRSYLATSDAPPRGRDLHHGDLERGIVSPISHVGALVPVMAGFALASRLRGEDRVALTFVGDGSTRTGEFHEGLSLAAARRLPLVVVVQNNRVALGTRTEEHTPAPFENLAAAYGARGLSCDGNNVLDTWAAASEAVEHARSGEGPVVLVAHTFRMGGHATHDEVEARRLFEAEDFATWAARDPCGVFERVLADGAPLVEGEANEDVLRAVEEEVTRTIDEAAEAALASRTSRAPDPATVTHDVWSLSPRLLSV